MSKQNQYAVLWQVSKSKPKFHYFRNIFYLYSAKDILDLVRIKFKSDAKHFINYLQNLQR